MAYSYPELPLQGGFHGQTGSVYYPNRATNAATGNGMMADQPFRVAHVPTGNSMIVDQPYRMVTGYETANASTGDNMKTDQPFRAGNASTGNSMMNDHPFRMATDYESRAGMPGQYMLPNTYRPSTLYGGNGGNAGMAVGNGYMMPAYSQLPANVNYAPRGFHMPTPAGMAPQPTGVFGQTRGNRASYTPQPVVNESHNFEDIWYTPQPVVNESHNFEDIWYTPPASSAEPSFVFTSPAHSVSSAASSVVAVAENVVAENAAAPPATVRRRGPAQPSVNAAHFPVRYLRADKGNYLQQGREFGLSFRQLSDLIRAQRLSEDDTCNESSLRGIYRAHMKSRAQRPRRPMWTWSQVNLLGDAVQDQVVRHRRAGKIVTMNDLHMIRWKEVAAWMVEHGSGYQFGPTACKRMFVHQVKEDWLMPLN